MKILFDELFKDATVTATNESLNYPVLNIVHPWLHKRFQSTSTGSLITATFTDDQCMDCFFYAYHDLTALSVVYKDSGGSTLATVSITDPDDIGIEYFTQLTTVRSVEITITGTYIGKIGGGCCYTMPDVNADYTSGNIDNSNGPSSAYGQRLVNNVPKLRNLSYSFRELTLTLRNEIDALYTSDNIFFDLYENNRTKEPPIYGFFRRPFNFTYNPRRYSLNMQIEEAK